MNVLIIDMTHGGALIASEFSKIPQFNVFALDIYGTLSKEKKRALTEKDIEFIEENVLNQIKSHNKSDLKDNFLIVAPVHCNIQSEVHMTHHEAIRLLLQDKIKVPVIEVTGVKGKTSVVWMLKEIFKDLNPLVLSSLGVEVLENGESKILKRNISITPASILEAWKMAQNYNVGVCIFETSLGGTGLADVGVLTNVIENYSIASGSKTAGNAKAQIFSSDLIVCDFDAYNQFYSHIDAKVNTFGINKNASLKASKIDYNLDKTTFKVDVRGLKTKKGDILNASFPVETFAPAQHHLLNVLCAICTSLSLKTPIEKIINGLKDFKGVEGRTFITNYQNVTIIEEINPGINVTAIKKSVQMIENFEAPAVIFGGKYGVTCEEIDEKSAAAFFNATDERIKLLLVDELGKNMSTLIKRKYKYTDFNNAIEEALRMNSKIILLIYRSNFSDISRR